VPGKMQPEPETFSETALMPGSRIDYTSLRVFMPRCFVTSVISCVYTHKDIRSCCSHCKMTLSNG
jgi:hypothetical protein